MPTQKHRISVTLEDDVYAELQRLAELGKQPMGSIVRELVDAFRPTLQRMVAAMEEYSAADADKQRQMLAQLEHAHNTLLPAAAQLIEQADDAWDFNTASEIGSTADPDDL